MKQHVCVWYPSLVVNMHEKKVIERRAKYFPLSDSSKSSVILNIMKFSFFSIFSNPNNDLT